jgi:hypothetical protein
MEGRLNHGGSEPGINEGIGLAEQVDVLAGPTQQQAYACVVIRQAPVPAVWPSASSSG